MKNLNRKLKYKFFLSNLSKMSNLSMLKLDLPIVKLFINQMKDKSKEVNQRNTHQEKHIKP